MVFASSFYNKHHCLWNLSISIHAYVFILIMHSISLYKDTIYLPIFKWRIDGHLCGFQFSLYLTILQRAFLCRSPWTDMWHFLKNIWNCEVIGYACLWFTWYCTTAPWDGCYQMHPHTKCDFPLFHILAHTGRFISDALKGEKWHLNVALICIPLCFF